MVRPATQGDLDRIMEIYEAAKVFMRENGNPTQWDGSYPERDLLKDDIKKSQLYVVKREYICGCFALIEGEDPTYGVIDGEWIYSSPYATIHRIASDGSEKGVLKECLDFARARYSHLRVDTHEDNKPMQNAVTKFGFTYCGIIYLENGDPRLAYEWEESSGNK